MRRLAPVFPFLALCFLLAEIAARATIDIKLYGADAEIGYWVLPDQSGGSLLVGSYAINPQGFGVSEPFQTTSRNDVLLIGDSLVFGTSKLDQHERLGPVLERLTGWEVWPLSAGSWTLANQLRMLKRVPLDGVEAIVFILNAEDFGPPSHWRNEYDSPRGEPRFYLPYAMRKIIPQLRQSDEPIPIRRGDLRAEWKRFRTRTQVPAIVVGYESAKTTGNQCEWLPNWLDVTTLCFDPVERREHSNMLDSVHLNAKGNESFARFLAARDLLQVERTTE